MVLDISQRWLATGELPREPYVSLPRHFLAKVNASDLLSAVFDSDLSEIIPKQVVVIAEQSKALQIKFEQLLGLYDEMSERERMEFWQTKEWLKLRSLIARLELPVRRTIEAMAAGREISMEQKEALTQLTVGGNSSGVKQTWAAFLKRLNLATAERGMKSQLAKHMGVPLPNVSQWLSGEREPSGANTLQLLQWVEQQERQQQKCPGSASTPPERKTRSTRSSHENVKTSPPKR